MEVLCPECRRGFEFRLGFEAAYCWGGASPAVAFKCPHCCNSIYFGPRAGEIALGFIGAGPPIDPIPAATYPIPIEVQRSGQFLTMTYEGHVRTIPSVIEYLRESTK